MFINDTKNDNILSSQRGTGLLSALPPNQSLKLTEPTVDDFATHQKKILGKRIGLQAVILPTNFPLSTEQSPKFGSSSNTKI